MCFVSGTFKVESQHVNKSKSIQDLLHLEEVNIPVPCVLKWILTYRRSFHHHNIKENSVENFDINIEGM